MSLRIGLPLVAAAALSLPLLAQTQTRPNLAGTWQPIPEKSTARPATAAPLPPLTISQDATAITISNVAFTPPSSSGTFDSRSGTYTPGPPQERREFPFTQTYVCDGLEHPDPDKVPPLPPGDPRPPTPAGAKVSVMTFEVTYRATWSADQFVLTTRQTSKVEPPPPNFVSAIRTTRKTYVINTEGLLVVESLTTSDTPSQASSQPASTPTPVRSVYRKGS